jgi:hypothetical protein
MTLGLENKKKTAALGVLVLVMLYMIYTNVLSTPSVPAPAPAAESSRADSVAEIERAAEVARPAAVPGAPARSAAPPKARNEEFHPVLRSKRQDQQQIDPLLVDPTLHLQALARLQSVAAGGAARNLFQFGAPPPPPASKVRPPMGPEPRIAMNQPPTPAQPINVQPPPPPPPPFKYYGLVTVRSTGVRRAYFLDGDEMIIAPEGGMLKKRYRVVRISPDSVTLEDTQLNRQQSVRISEDVNGPA